MIHSPYGGRINRAWGLALRKRFCRKFNFELQAAATEDNIVLSLTTAHSFDLGEVRRYLHSASVRSVLIQALLDAPMFITRWRWVAGVSLALPRFRGGKKVPPQLARMDAEDLIAAVFPDQLACAENLVGEREIPDHPLIRQTIADCLDEAMDIDGLERLLTRLEAGEISVVTRDLTEPSPLALEVLSARPYAYLDDAPLEERRTQAVMAAVGWRRRPRPTSAGSIPKRSRGCTAKPGPIRPMPTNCTTRWRGSGFLLPRKARRTRLERVVRAAGTREARDAAHSLSIPVTPAEAGVQGPLDSRFRGNDDGRDALWVAAERLPQFLALWPGGETRSGDCRARTLCRRDGRPRRRWSRSCAAGSKAWGRSPRLHSRRRSGLGRKTSPPRSPRWRPKASRCAAASRRSCGAEEWCERRLLARIHRYTLGRLRAEIEPVAARDFLRFLFDWQRVAPRPRMEGPDALAALLGQLEGFEAPAGAWETEILPARVAEYEPAWLDDHCLAGRIAWARLRPRKRRPNGSERSASAGADDADHPAGAAHAALWAALSPLPDPAGRVPGRRRLPTSRRKRRLVLRRAGRRHRAAAAAGRGGAGRAGGAGPRQFRQLRRAARAARAGRPARRRGRRRRARCCFGMEDAGRWALARRAQPQPQARARGGRALARTLLRRYGVVFWRLLEREAAWLPPWRDLLRVYRRLEARGEIRGGRFVAGFSGEQFALARGGRHAARGPPQAGLGRMGVAVRRRPAQSGRHPDPGAQARRADRQPRALPRRNAGRAVRRRRGAVPRRARHRGRMAGTESAAARRRAGLARCVVLTATISRSHAAIWSWIAR